MAKRKHNSSRHKSIGKRVTDAFNALTEGIENFFKALFRNIGQVASFVGAMLIPKALTKRMDQATKSTGDSVGKKVGAITEKVEKEFSKGASGIFTSLGYVFKIFVPKPLADWYSKNSKAISKWFGSLFRSFGKWLGSLAERYLPKWLVLYFKRLSLRASRAQRTASKFNTAWWKSRDFHALAWATPAFLLAVPSIAGLMLTMVSSPSAKIGHYQSVMFTALEDKEFEKADLFSQKLRQLGYGKMQAVAFNKALAFAIDGKYQVAYEQMRVLARLPGDNENLPPIAPVDAAAPEDIMQESAYVPAHVWIAGAVLQGDVEIKDKSERMMLVKQHAEAALALEPKHAHAKYLLVRYFVQTQQLPLAIQPMKELASEYRHLNGELMEYYIATNNPPESNTLPDARNAANRFARHVKSEERKSATDYYRWCIALELTGRLVEASSVAREAGQAYPQDPRVRKVAKKVVLSLLKAAKNDSSEATDLLREAHELDPKNEAVIARLAKRWVEQPARVNRMVEEMKERNTASPLLFLRAGDLHSHANQNDKAIDCFEQAIEVDSNCAAAYNNLAWIRANLPPLNIQDALEKVTKAIEIEPQAGYFETRGQIHFQLDKLTLAANDLERAINGGIPRADQLNSHQTLEKIYRRLGNIERASAHESRAQSMLPPQS